MKGIPLAYINMQEDKEALFDGLDTLFFPFKTLMEWLKTMKVIKSNMKKSAAGDLQTLPMLLIILLKRYGIRNAHEVVGK